MPDTLLSIFPNPANLLALPPEELGGILLELSYNIRGSNGLFSIENFRDQVFSSNERAYPSSTLRAVLLALAEALNWLQVEGLLINDPQQSSGLLIRTKRATALQTRADVAAFRKGQILPAALLQPSLAERVLPPFLRGDVEIAVFQAFKDVEVAVRKISNELGAGYSNELVGVSLMRKAFHPETGPLRNQSLVPAEREAEMHLFAGAIGHAKNPTSHRDVVLAPADAARLVVFASHLLSIVEGRKPSASVTMTEEVGSTRGH